MASRSGLKVTAPIGVQFQVLPDQRAGFSSWACKYKACRACQNLMIITCMSLSRTNKANSTMTMIKVVPVDKAIRPSTSLIEIGKVFGGKFRARTNSAFSVAVADMML